MIRASVHDLLLQAYREQPGNRSHAARVADVDRRTAGAAWEDGIWVKEGTGKAWREPIQKFLEDERVRAAAMVAKAEEAARKQEEQDVTDQAFLTLLASEKKEVEAGKPGAVSRVMELLEARKQEEDAAADKLKKDAAAARAEETLVARLARGAAKQLLGSSTPLLAVTGQLSRALAQATAEKFFEVDAAGNIRYDAKSRPIVKAGVDLTLHSKEIMTLQGRVVELANRAVLLGESSQRIERLATGEPTEITQVNHQGQMTYEEAVELLGHAHVVHQKTQAIGGGGLSVLPGGKASSSPTAPAAGTPAGAPPGTPGGKNGA